MTPATCNLPTHHVSVTVVVQVHIGVESVTLFKTLEGGCLCHRCMQMYVCTGDEDCRRYPGFM